MDNTKVFECERYSATAVPVHPVLVPCNRGSETSCHRPLSQAVVLGERILTRVGRYQATSKMTTRVVSTDRLQRLVQRDFTEPSAVLMRQRTSSHAEAANNARFFRAERSIKSTPLEI